MKHLYVAADLIETAGLAEIGTDLFVNSMPADVHSGVMLRDPLNGADLDEGMGDYVKHEFQVIVRNPDPEAAWQLAKAIGEVLRVDSHSSTDVFILKMAPLSLPVSYPKMDSDEMETSLRMRVAFALT